jgi:hypothetical protein
MHRAEEHHPGCHQGQGCTRLAVSWRNGPAAASASRTPGWRDRCAPSLAPAVPTPRPPDLPESPHAAAAPWLVSAAAAAAAATRRVAPHARAVSRSPGCLRLRRGTHTLRCQPRPVA